MEAIKMRQLLIPKYERFDFNQPLEEMNKKNVNEVIEEVSEHFNDYLGQLNIFATTKSALMGPVGKILEQARVKGLDAEFLKGYGISVHKNDKRLPALSSQTLVPFEEGIVLLSRLLQKVPRHMRPKVVEIIDYKVYYRRMKENIQKEEERKQAFVEFLQGKYREFGTFAKECEIEAEVERRKITNFNDAIFIPWKTSDKFYTLVQEFNKSRTEIILEEEAEE
jgi:hypothetical protein